MVSSIHQLLQLIRKQNGALLGRKSAETLSAFLGGFALARRGSGDSADDDFLRAFNDFVHRRFHVESTQGWAKIIAFYSSDESEELGLFWKLYDQFMVGRPARSNGHRPKARKIS